MWTEQNNQLVRVYEFNSSARTFAFIADIKALADRLWHHPTLSITDCRVLVSLQTHDAGNRVTEKDRAMAEEIDLLFKDSEKK